MASKNGTKTRKSLRLQEKEGNTSKTESVWSGVEDPEKIVRQPGQEVPRAANNNPNNLPIISINPGTDLPGELTNYTQHTTSQSMRLTYLEETPTKDVTQDTPPNEISRLSSIYTKPVGERLNTTGEERLAMELMNDNFHEILGSEDKRENITAPGNKFLSLDWVIPDGTNRTIHDVKCDFANFPSPGGGQGAITLALPEL